MAKQEKLYTVKELSQELKVSDKRVYQLIEKWVYTDENKPKLNDYIDNTTPKKKYKKATLSLLLLKQKENSKFQRFHK